MTLEELSKVVGRSEKTLTKNFYRTKENLAKKGVYIERYGTGKTAVYEVTFGSKE